MVGYARSFHMRDQIRPEPSSVTERPNRTRAAGFVATCARRQSHQHFPTIRFAATHMKRQKDGRIAMTSSIAGLQSERMIEYDYNVTKVATINLLHHATIEPAPYNVMVNVICPGPLSPQHCRWAATE